MTYSSSVGGRVRAFIVGILITVVLAIAAPFLLHEAGVSRVQSELLGASAIAVAVIGLLWTLVHVFVTGPVSITTSPTHVQLTRGRRVRENWARAETGFSSFVIRQSTNGVKTGSVRKLIAHTAREQVEVVLPWFSAETYNALIADVAPLVPTGPGAPPVARVVPTTSFAIQRSSTRLTVRLVAIAVALAVLAVVIGFIVLEVDASVPAIPLAAAGALLLFAVIAVPIVRAERAIPRAITVGQSTLQFDDRVFSVAQLSAVRATPAGYTDQRRSIALTETTGRTTVLPLGHANDKSFPDYAELVEAIRQATAHRPGLFTLAVA